MTSSRTRTRDGDDPALRRRPNAVLSAALLCCAWMMGIETGRGAANDNNVEWNGAHSDASFRAPIHPSRGEEFQIGLQVFRGDITSARVRVYDGTERHVAMAWVANTGTDGQYDLWRADIPTSGADFLYYRFEITDGSDTDYFNRMGMWADEPGHGDFLLNLTDLGAYSPGATVEGDGAVFRVWAPNADAVHVAGDFNGWSATAHPLQAVAGIWQGRIAGAAASDQYKFVIDNNGIHWRTDPRARRQVNSVGNSILWDPATFAWSDGAWVTPFFEDLILYELHVGTFAGDGDGATGHPSGYRAVVRRHLDHLVESGINAVQLMPVMEFAGDLSWGYNPAFQYAPESAYGSPDDLKFLIDECHHAGLAVLLDVVFNHMGASDLAGNVLEFDGEEIYFYPPGSAYRETPWGPRPDYGRREVREYIGESIGFWLEEYRIDGFRIDGTDFIKVNTDGWRVLQDIARAADRVSRKAVVIAEQLPNDPAVTRPIDEGGAGMDAQWNDELHDHLRAAVEAAAFGDPNMGALAAGMNHFEFGGVRAVNYIESHDEAAVHGRIVRAADGSDPHSRWAYGRGKLAYGLVMFTAGMPMILQGQELMEDRPFGDTEAHRVQWNYKTQYGDYALACRDMTWLRRRHPGLRADARQNVFHVNESANVVAWHRWTEGGDDAVIVASFNNESFSSYCLGMPLAGVWREALNSDAAEYGGDGVGNGGSVNADQGALHGLPHSACLTLPAMGLLVLSRQAVDLTPDVDADNDGIPSGWERAHGMDANDRGDAGVDADGDGKSGYEEYVAGTDPSSAVSRFAIERLEPASEVGWIVIWQSAADREYAVQWRATLAPGPWEERGVVPGTGGEVQFQDESGSAPGQGYYRLEVRVRE